MWKSHHLLESPRPLPRDSSQWGSPQKQQAPSNLSGLEPYLLCTICLWPLPLLCFEDRALSSDRWVALLNTSCGPLELTYTVNCTFLHEAFGHTCTTLGVYRHSGVVPRKNKTKSLFWFELWVWKLPRLWFNQPKEEWIPVTQLLKHITVLSYHQKRHKSELNQSVHCMKSCNKQTHFSGKTPFK